MTTKARVLILTNTEKQLEVGSIIKKVVEKLQ